jgi:hypothetical protein
VLKEFIAYIHSLKDQGHFAADLTTAHILRCIYGIDSESDYDSSSPLRKIHYEDFLEYMCRMIFSDYWIQRNDVNNDQRENESSEEKKGATTEDEFAVVTESAPVLLNNPSSQDLGAQRLYLRLMDWLNSF